MGAKIEVFFTKLYKKILFRNVLLTEIYNIKIECARDI